MKADLRIKHTGRTWKLDGTTVVKDMNSTEMLFRIAIMKKDELMSLVDNLNGNELHDIVMKIRDHRKEAQDAGVLPKEGWPSVTKYVVNKHLTKAGLN